MNDTLITEHLPFWHQFGAIYLASLNLEKLPLITPTGTAFVEPNIQHQQEDSFQDPA